MVSCLMGDSTALASAIVRCCLRQFYHVELPEFDMVKFDETITQAESKMIHINW